MATTGYNQLTSALVQTGASNGHITLSSSPVMLMVSVLHSNGQTTGIEDFGHQFVIHARSRRERIIQGMDSTHLDPQGYTTRAQAVVVLQKLLQKLGYLN